MKNSDASVEKQIYRLDITSDVCPMTFVRTRLLIEKMHTSDMAEIRLQGEEPKKNIPESVVELGHTIISLTAEAGSALPPVYLLRIKKN
jgi:TusA-related sulfurtransferase